MDTLKNKTVAVVGLGYVGLPLAVEFGKYRSVVSFDPASLLGTPIRTSSS